MWEYVILVIGVIIVLLIALCGRKQNALVYAAEFGAASNSLPGLGPALPAQSLVGGARRRPGSPNTRANNNGMWAEEDGIVA